jgi:hypothetical protein
MTRTRLAALTLTVAALTASGCGGSGKSTTDGATTTNSAASSEKANSGQTVSSASNGGGQTLGQTEFVAKANTICQRLHAERRTLPSINKPQDYQTVLEHEGSLEEVAVRELEKLTPSAPLAADWSQVIRADRTLAGDTLLYGKYMSTNNTRAGRAVLLSAESEIRRMAVVAKRDGLSACSSFAS